MDAGQFKERQAAAVAEWLDLHRTRCKLRERGEWLDGHCPIPGHDDGRPSFAVHSTSGGFVCHGCGQKGNFRTLAELTGFKVPANLWRPALAVYPYTRGGKVEAIKTKYAKADGKKTFVWEGGNPGVLYQEDRITEARDKGEPVYLVEGEKDADRLNGLDLYATTAPIGATEKWEGHYTDALLGVACVHVLGDNDTAGRDHVADAAGHLARGGVPVKVVDLYPNAEDREDKRDISDWLDEGHTREDLLALFAAAPVRCSVVGVESLLGMKLPPREYVLAPWMPTKTMTMLYGPRGAGKTWLTLGTAVAVAAGCTFARWTAPKPRKVLFVDGELSREELVEKLRALLPALRLTPAHADALDRNLRIITPEQLLDHDLDVPNIADATGQAFIERHLAGVEYLVLDNLSTLCRGGVENEAESWQPVQDWLVRLRVRGVNSMFAHHAGRSGFQRGTTKREDVVQYILNVREVPNHDPNLGLYAEIRFEKSRGKHKDPKAVSPFTIQVGTAAAGQAAFITQDLEEDKHARMIELYRDGVPQREIPDALGVSKAWVSKHLKTARQRGELG